MYAVLDVETTGLNPGWRHRVTEIAVVLLDQHGRVEREWCSLVNPQRDLGPHHVHGIRDADAHRAPTFDCLAGKVSELLAGRVVAAHNLTFHSMFLRHEFRLIGVEVPVRQEVGLCTMALAAQYMPVTARSLRDCCVAAGVRLEIWHSALADARAAAGLLATYLSVTSGSPPWAQLLATVERASWPSLPPSDVKPVVRSSRHSPEQDVLSRLADQLPRVRQPGANGYLALLDRELVEQRIPESQADELVSLADEYGLDRATVAELHHAYLLELARAARVNGGIPGAERRALERMARLLGVSCDAVNEALGPAGTPAGDEELRADPAVASGLWRW